MNKEYSTDTYKKKYGGVRIKYNFERFQLIKKEKDTYSLKDTNDEVHLNISTTNKDEMSELIHFLNKRETLLYDTVLKYGDNINELIDLKMKIAHTIQEEIQDCKILVEVDEFNPYVQGRLIELHNLMKVLL